jgi:hypothetical protein
MTGTVVKLKTLRHRMLTWQIGTEVTIESYELSHILGYVQWGSLRKQTLTDWKDWMINGTDFIMVYGESEMRWYEKTMFALLSRTVDPVSPSRGYLMFTGAGIAKILSKTKKVAGPAFRNDTMHLWPELDPDYEFVAPDALAVAPVQAPAPPSAEDRKYQYEVLQTLLSQLKEFDDPAMREVAITAAEAATGKDFSNLRETQVIRAPLPAPVRIIPQVQPKPVIQVVKRGPGPLFDIESFYSLKTIGEKAGGYSSGTAGKAANIVAERMGYTPEQIRRTQLSFNQLPNLRDTNGTLRQMFRFGKEFANGVIKELRTNTRFRPTPVPTITAFSEGANQHVSLTTPLDLGEDEDEAEAEEEISDNMVSFLHTLKPGTEH